MISRNRVLAGIVCMALAAGCASGPAVPEEELCSKVARPLSYKVYVYVKRDADPPDALVQALAYNTSSALLVQEREVKVVKDLRDVGTDGMRVEIELVRNFRGGVSKRIDIRYDIINNATQAVMVKGTGKGKSKLGYNKIAVKLGRQIANKVGEVIRCFEKGGVQAAEKRQEPDRGAI